MPLYRQEPNFFLNDFIQFFFKAIINQKEMIYDMQPRDIPYLSRIDKYSYVITMQELAINTTSQSADLKHSTPIEH